MPRSSSVVVVVTDRGDLPEIPAERLITADEYLAGEQAEGVATVINLCRSYRYRAKGYYVSLLADARGQTCIPAVETIEELADPFGVFRVLQEARVATVEAPEPRQRRRHLPAAVALDSDDSGPAPPRQSAALLRAAADDALRYRTAAEAELVEVLCVFGRCPDARFKTACLAVFRIWRTPLLRLQFLHEDGEWKVAYVAAATTSQLSQEERAQLADALSDVPALLRRAAPPKQELKRASIAVLTDADDPFSPSSPETIDKLARVARRMNVHVYPVGQDEIQRLGEYDALLIRALTGVREPAFQWALRAEALDMPVIDDTQSIIRCSNKVFLEELLRREGLPTPRTLVVTPRTPWAQVQELGMPFVLKLPDGSFSAAVHRCASERDYRTRAAEMFRRSPLLIAQEYLPTEFDWRVTVLDGRVLFTARYFMASGHWQIRSEDASGSRYGRVEAVPRDTAPPQVVRLALEAAGLIGRGIYGVDIKETERGPVVIEVNDNPNLDVGYDDAADGNLIYEDIIWYFLRRIEEPHPGLAAATPEPPEAAEGPGGTESAATEPSRRREARHFRPYEVIGIELEYPIVDRDLNVLPRVEDLLRAIAGRPTSDAVLGRIELSNEIADHVLELKTPAPSRSLAQAERALAGGVQQTAAALRAEFGGRLLPTGMHPWLDPRRARIWQRSNARVYQTYARLFDIQTHGWMNVHASHVNLPMAREEDAVAMYNAAALLIPYLPAIAASSPMYEGELQDAVDNRLAWILRHQSRIPESQGRIVPEFVDSLSSYRRDILRPMYEALDRLPDAGALRHDFFNARGAVFKFAGRRMELRVLDTQECVKMDVAIAAFARAALRSLGRRLNSGKMPLPEHDLLVDDFTRVVQHGTAARVRAPHLNADLPRDDQGTVAVREVLRSILADARRTARKDELEYLEIVADIVEQGSLSECIRERLLPFADDDEGFTEAARRVYIELADCLEGNTVWAGRRGSA